MTAIHIIRATTENITQLQPLAITTFRETYETFNTPEDMRDYLSRYFNEAQLTHEINSPDSSYYLAFHQDAPIGYIKLNTGNAQTDLRDQNTLEIERIYVLQQHQGLKAGRQLLDKAIAVAREKKVAFLWLGVWDKNEKAQGFYRKHNFVPFGTHIFRLGADEQTDILMKRDIWSSRAETQD
ncbi:GNAT family N-acetyltransferase [Chitinophaga qingshengii]|uniref:GNAT family N-acetyltransferase n=1 Tax=Chitinophaga qingshengii TaxID=1569794 RepID=A0ABR7TX59_9BACT|nr:GNAT family N-acetyltransferase [Chitinophaga qingshengii]MBC9935033.1 GNAT family N-acetyltransferase [Chitinophaga qingshengii]